MTENSAPSAARKSGSLAMLWRLMPVVRPHLAALAVGLAMIPLIAWSVRQRPLIAKDAINVDIAHNDPEGLMVSAYWFFGFVLLEYAANGVSMFALQRAGHRIIAALREKVFRHVLALPARYFDRSTVGTLVSRTTSDVEALGETLSNGVFTIMTDVVTIALIVGTMFAQNTALTIYSLAVAPVLFLVVRFFSARLRSLHLEIRKAQGVTSSHLTEHLGGVGVLQLFGRESRSVAEYGELGSRYLRGTKRANVYEAVLFSLMDGISSFCVALLLYFGARELGLGVVGGEALTVGLLYAFVEFLQRIFVPIKEFSNKIATVQRAVAALERIYGLLDQPTEPRSSDDENARSDEAFLTGWTGGLEVRDLHFRYGKGEPDILRGVDFEIAPGAVVAVVGRSGSGKTSLGRVLTRTYTGYRGNIELRGEAETRELSTIAPDLLRRRMLMVQQDVFLFDDSIGRNVALGHPDLVGEEGEQEEARVRAALETVRAADFARARAGRNWLELPVGERGRALSVGEAQLVAFARVAAREPKLLILDEATSNVDSATEHHVQRAVERLLDGRSVLVIAHRLSTVRHADMILVMDHGRIVERGRHDELLAQGGLYAELIESSLTDEA